MLHQTWTPGTPAKQTIKVKMLSRAEAATKVSYASACRAYEIFKSRGSVPGHEREHWLLAESELLRPLCFGMLETDDEVRVGTDAPVFKSHEVEICVEPHRLMIIGEPEAGAEPNGTDVKRPGAQVMYRVCNPLAEVNPSHIRVKVNGCMLEIVMRKAAAVEGNG